jgi:hypothetical protein
MFSKTPSPARPARIATALIFLATASIALPPLAAQPASPASPLVWDGGAGTPIWDDAANWSGDEAPTPDDTVVFNSSTQLRDDWRAFVKTGRVNQLEIDMPNWGLRPIAKVGVLRIKGGELRFSPRYTNTENKTFGPAIGGKRLRLIFERSGRIINEGTGIISFTGAEAVDVGITSGKQATAFVYLDGRGNFLWENGTVFDGVRSFGTAPDFSGIFEIRGGQILSSKAFVCAGGTTRVRANDVFQPEIDLVLDGQGSGPLPVLDLSGATGTVKLLRAEGRGGRLIVDAQTNYTFEDYGGGPIAIEGFVEGQTRLQFNTSLEGRPLTGLSINGTPAGVTTE